MPASFRHPRANREALLCDAVVAYEFRRGKRRNIGFMVGPDGLVVSAPNWVPLYEVDAALQDKSRWIVRKLGDAHERRQRAESARIEWRDGALFPFLGEQVIVVLDPRHAFDEVGARAQHRRATRLPRACRASPCTSACRRTRSRDQIRDAVQAWLMRQAQRVFTERLDHFAPQLGVQVAQAVPEQRRHPLGHRALRRPIRLNWRLIHFRQSVIDYVVAHELSHLRVMDHSPRFWDTVGIVVPEYTQLRRQLKEEALAPW